MPAQANIRDQQAGQYLNHFRHHLVLSVSGYVASPLWRTLILQALHEEPAVCHAAIAFSALNRMKREAQFDVPSKPSTPGVEAGLPLQHYGKCIVALRLLLRRDDARSVDAALLCSLLCVCFEVLKGDYILAQGHLEHSLNIIQSKPGSKIPTCAMTNSLLMR
jgi:hypothetical protein